MIEWSCPECSAAISTPAENSGRIGTCTQCHARIKIPDPDATLRDFQRDEKRQRSRTVTVQSPALAMIAVGTLGFAVALFVAARAVTQFDSTHRYADYMKMNIVLAAIGTLWGIIVVIGGLYMLNYRARSSCLFASVVAMLPCNPICLFSLPVGIWAYVTLSRQAVKHDFELRGS